MSAAPPERPLIFWCLWTALALSLLALGTTDGVARRFMLRSHRNGEREIHVVNHGLIGVRVVTPNRREGYPERVTYKWHAEQVSKRIEQLDDGDLFLEVLEGRRRLPRILDLWYLGWAVIMTTVAGLALSAWLRRKRPAWLPLLVAYVLLAFGLLGTYRYIAYAFVDPVYEFAGPPQYVVRWHPAALIWIAWTIVACAVIAISSRGRGTAPRT